VDSRWNAIGSRKKEEKQARGYTKRCDCNELLYATHSFGHVRRALGYKCFFSAAFIEVT
jgi:hypothetical protein